MNTSKDTILKKKKKKKDSDTNFLEQYFRFNEVRTGSNQNNSIHLYTHFGA